MKKTRTEAESLPKWYGIAYRDYSANVDVCYPIGINWIMRFWLHLEFIVRSPTVSNIEAMTYWRVQYEKETKLRKYWEDGYRADVGKLMRVVQEEDEDGKEK